MQNASNSGGLRHYLRYCCVVLIPIYLVAYALFQLQESPSLLERYEAQYLLIHAAFMLVFLVLSKGILLRRALPQAILWGIITGFLITCLALPLSTALSLNDGLERLSNSYELFGVLQMLASFLLFSAYSGAWLLGAVVFGTVFWLCLSESKNKKVLIALLILSFVLAVSLLVFSSYLKTDRCLDAGGSWNSGTHLCVTSGDS